MPHQMEALAETFNPLLRYSTYLFTRTTASSCLRPVVRFLLHPCFLYDSASRAKVASP